MKKSKVILSAVALLIVAACAPISAEKVAATARPAGDTAISEHAWSSQTEQAFRERVAATAADCSVGGQNADCLQAKLAAAWSSSAAYQSYCKQGDAFAVASCMIEYDFWARMGQKFYPSYRIRDEWASFNLPKNPTFVEWFTKVNFACDPNMNKSQDAFYTCAAAAAKRDLGIEKDATKGCYYSDLHMATLCYWMAAFNALAEERVKLLPGA